MQIIFEYQLYYLRIFLLVITIISDGQYLHKFVHLQMYFQINFKLCIQIVYLNTIFCVYQISEYLHLNAVTVKCWRFFSIIIRFLIKIIFLNKCATS